VRVPAVVVALYLGPALAVCQSLGDAARGEADKRAGRPSATAKAYTDADLRPEQTEAAAVDARDAPAATSATPDEGPAVASPPLAGDPATDEVRARLDREAEQRRQQELLWRNRALQARARSTPRSVSATPPAAGRAPPDRGLTEEGARQGPGGGEGARESATRLGEPRDGRAPAERPSRLVAQLTRRPGPGSSATATRPTRSRTAPASWSCGSCG
jgi:hypothetical protein